MEEKTKFCKYCGEKIDFDCVVCPKCGKQVEQLKNEGNVVINNSVNNSTNGHMFVTGSSHKSRKIALILAIFLGEIGAHYFYVGRYGKGILYLFTMGLFGFGWIIDIISICIGRFRDQYGNPLIQW